MKQTVNKATKKSDSLWSNIIIQHSAVNPIFKHDLPRSLEKNASNHGRDFSRLPLNATDTTGLKTHLAQACPFTPQRCPFGGACHTCPPRVQAKLKISQPGDQYELEADRVAEQVMRMPESQIQRKGCSSCRGNEEDEDKILQAKSKDGFGSAQIGHPLIQNVLSSPGQPLDTATRNFMEPRFGQDFSGVQVHTGSKAAESARAVDARAYTVGSAVVFGAGQYQPGTQTGQRLLAHELTHILHQRKHFSTTVSKENKFIQRQQPTTGTTQTPPTAFVYITVGDRNLGLAGGLYADKMETLKIQLLNQRISNSWTLVIAMHGAETFLATTTTVYPAAKNAIQGGNALPPNAYDLSKIQAIFSGVNWDNWRKQFGPTYVVLYGCQVNEALERGMITAFLRSGSTQIAQGLGKGCRPHREVEPIFWTPANASKEVEIKTRHQFNTLGQGDRDGIKAELEKLNMKWGYGGGPPVSDVLQAYFDFPVSGKWIIMKVSVEDPNGPDMCGTHPCEILDIPFYNRASNTLFNTKCNTRGQRLGGPTGVGHQPSSPTMRRP